MVLDRPQLGANLAMLTLGVVSTLTYYVCWRWCETARARKMTEGGRAGSSSLPSPIALLPRWLPFLGGHTLQMETEKLDQQVQAWADEFGRNFEVTIAGSTIVFVTNAEDIHRIFLQRPTNFRRGWRPTHFSWMAERIGLGPSLFFDEGKQWGRSRRIISPALNGHHNVANMIPAMAKIAERVCSKLDEQDGGTVEFVETFERYTHDVIALAGFGFDADSVRSTKDRSSVSFDAMRKVVAAFMRLLLDPLSMLGWETIPTLLPWVRATKLGTRSLHQVVQGAIDVTRRQMQEGSEISHVNGGGLLRKLVSVEGSGDGTTKGINDRMKFSDKEILKQVMGLFVAGSETTSRTMSWMTYYLAKHPEMHARCREEALRVAPLSGGIVSTPEQASQLVFCAALFKETLRLWPAAPLLFLYNTEPVTLKGGMEFEAGTPFTTVLRHPCLSEDAFTRAKDFVPERWIEAEREEALLGSSSKGGDSVGDVIHREEVMHAFGAGPRKCPGSSVAHLEAIMMLSAICAQFDLVLAPHQADPPTRVMTLSAGVKSLNLVVTRTRPA
eukprot:g7361.t1